MLCKSPNVKNRWVAIAWALEQEGNQGPGVTPVGVVAGAERLTQDLFFEAAFAQVSYEQYRDSNEGVNLAGRDGRSDEHAEHRSVDGMAEQVIGSSADQFVAFSDSDFRAPIAAQVPARPNSEKNECCLDGRADGDEDM